MNVTPLLGNVRSTFGTMPLYRPETPSRRMMSRSEEKKPRYRGAFGAEPCPAFCFPSNLTPTDLSLCCMRARTTCEGYVTVDSNSFEATPSHAHSNAEGGTVAGPFCYVVVVMSVVSRFVRHARRRSYAANCNAPCDTKNTLGPRPLYKPAMPSFRAI